METFPEIVPSAADDQTETTLINPRTGMSRGVCGVSRQHDIKNAVAAAQDAADNWRVQTPRIRSQALYALAQAIEERAEGYARAEIAGTGKPFSEAIAEVLEAADVFRFFAGASRAQSVPGAGLHV